MVKIGIGTVVELERGKAARNFLGGGAAAANGSRHAFRLRSANHRCAKAAHEDAFLFSKAFGHKEHNLVAAMHADQGESYAGIACGSLNDRRTGLEQAAAFGIQNHAQRRAILDTPPGFRNSSLAIDVGRPRGRDAVKMEHGGGPHQIRDIFSNMQSARSNSRVERVIGQQQV